LKHQVRLVEEVAELAGVVGLSSGLRLELGIGFPDGFIEAAAIDFFDDYLRRFD
jgi:hypothetical protein